MTTISVAEAKIKRRTIKATATRIKGFLESSDPAQLSCFDLTERLKKLTSLWEQFDDVQTVIERSDYGALGDNDDSNIQKQHNEERSSFEIPYFKLVARYEATLRDIQFREIQPNDSPQISVLPSNSNQAISQLRLPKIELPVFSGNIEDWYTFYDTFEKLINANSNLSEIQKFHYLKSSLKGDAAGVVKTFEITTENYKEAWELLIERYDNRRHIVQSHIRSIFELPTLSKENHTQLRSLLDGVCKHLRALKAFERPVDSWDDLVIHLIVSKLDTNTKRAWETSRSDSSIPTFKQLKEFLFQRLENALRWRQ